MFTLFGIRQVSGMRRNWEVAVLGATSQRERPDIRDSVCSRPRWILRPNDFCEEPHRLSDLHGQLERFLVRALLPGQPEE
jgi:hypothetical protein